MGSVRVELVKKVAERLLRDHPGKFSEDFEANKKALDELVEVGSKKLRNLIAGYITGLLSQRKGASAEERSSDKGFEAASLPALCFHGASMAR